MNSQGKFSKLYANAADMVTTNLQRFLCVFVITFVALWVLYTYIDLQTIVYSDSLDLYDSKPSKTVKLYIYPLPTNLLPKYNVPSDGFGWQYYEQYVLSALPTTNYTVSDPEDADWFVIPHISASIFDKTNDVNSTATHLIGILNHVTATYPYFNRTKGTDHVMLFSKVIWNLYVPPPRSRELPKFTENMIYITPCAQVQDPYYFNNFIPHRDIAAMPLDVMPDLPSPNKPRIKNRKYLFVFFGSFNMDNLVYTNGVRQAVRTFYENQTDVMIKPSNAQADAVVNSRFCLLPLGWHPYTSRLITYIHLGCIPVIIADDLVLPYWRRIDWSLFSVRVTEADSKVEGRLREILANFTVDEVERMEQNLMRERPKLLYNYPSVEGDATYQIVQSLAAYTTPRQILHPLPVQL